MAERGPYSGHLTPQSEYSCSPGTFALTQPRVPTLAMAFCPGPGVHSTLDSTEGLAKGGVHTAANLGFLSQKAEHLLPFCPDSPPDFPLLFVQFPVVNTDSQMKEHLSRDPYSWIASGSRTLEIIGKPLYIIAFFWK